MGVEARELRIGNWIQSDDGEVFKIEGLKTYDIDSDEDMVRVYSIDSWLLLSDFRLITLTEEWLLKFGFTNGGYEMLLWIKGRFEIYGSDTVGFGLRINNIFDIDTLYVHHLQNLYYTLTGEELKLS